MVDVIASNDVPVVIMNVHDGLDSMHDGEMDDDFLSEIKRFFDERVKVALDAGINKDCIILDPGIGFGKTIKQNAELLKSAFLFR